MSRETQLGGSGFSTPVSQGTTHAHAAQHRLFFGDQALHSSSKPVQGNSTIAKSQKS
jgi:hypothetical protein